MLQEQVRVYYPPSDSTARTMPKRHLFLMGNSKPVQPNLCGDFIDSVVLGSLDSEHEIRAWFQIGFAAAIDMIARGTLDFTMDPNAVVELAWRDVNNITNEPNTVTDIMRIEV